MDIDRKTAFAVLLDVEKNEAFSNLALNRRIKENQPQNPAFVRELVYGVLKYQLLLDYQLDKLVKSGSKKLKKQDLTLLRMGLYQLTFMDAVPEYAAVSETVQLAKKYDFSRKIQLSQTPFAAKDGLNKEQAVKLCQEFTNIGMRAQIVRSKKKPVPIEEKKKSFWNII